jgi:multidrug efflux pump subunit AcrB
MWIVKLALNRPYTFIVAAILILILGFTSIATTSTDVFPNIDIPVITVIWTYYGLPAKEMEQRITSFCEFAMLTVNDVKAIDSQTTSGAAIIKISFNPQVHIDAAMSQVGAAVSSIRFRMPPSVNPPWLLRFSASTVPILQLALSSDTLSESDTYNYVLYRIRQQLGPIPGTLLPTPEGGVARQIMVDLDQNALRSRGMTPIDVTAAINAQNVTIPSGTAKIGRREYAVTTNSSPADPTMLTEAARAELLATKWGQRAPRSALVEGVALAYFEMRSLDAQLEITQSTIKARKESLQLTLALEQHGAASLADVRQAEELLHVAQANLPELRLRISVQENMLSVLLGHNPQDLESAGSTKVVTCAAFALLPPSDFPPRQPRRNSEGVVIPFFTGILRKHDSSAYKVSLEDATTSYLRHLNK